MRFRLAILLLPLLAVLPLMDSLKVPAAPAPEVYAILDIGPPPKGKTMQEHCKEQTAYLSHAEGVLLRVWHDPEIKKLPSVSYLTGKSAVTWIGQCPFIAAPPIYWESKNPMTSWMSKNLRVRAEEGGRRLRLIFQAGNRAEQVIILNTLLRIYMRLERKALSQIENGPRKIEEGMPKLEELIKNERNPVLLAEMKKQLESSPSRIAKLRAEVARLKQIVVIKWAK